MYHSRPNQQHIPRHFLPRLHSALTLLLGGMQWYQVEWILILGLKFCMSLFSTLKIMGCWSNRNWVSWHGMWTTGRKDIIIFIVWKCLCSSKRVLLFWEAANKHLMYMVILSNHYLTCILGANDYTEWDGWRCNSVDNNVTFDMWSDMNERCDPLKEDWIGTLLCHQLCTKICINSELKP